MNYIIEALVNKETSVEVYHIKWLLKGEYNTIENIVVLCPNCYRKIQILINLNDDVNYLERI